MINTIMDKSLKMLLKWGRPVVERGFTQVPNILLQVNMFVHDDHKLSAAELVILLQLVAAWWEKDDLPYPSMRTLSERSGISERQVQRAVKALGEKGYLVKVKKKLKRVIASNAYDLKPTVEILTEIANHYTNQTPREIDVEKDLSRAQVGDIWIDGDGFAWKTLEVKGEFVTVTPSYSRGEPRNRKPKAVNTRARSWFRQESNDV